LIGEGRALDIILSGRTVEATEAERIGLVTRLVDEGNPYTLGTEFLAPYLKHGLLALEMARQAISRGVQTTLEQGLKIERDLSTLIFQTADANEGMTAFVEKRPAIFKDH
jgi:enoyl-CoA hydratase